MSNSSWNNNYYFLRTKKPKRYKKMRWCYQCEYYPGKKTKSWEQSVNDAKKKKDCPLTGMKVSSIDVACDNFEFR